jgi:hypothetical protein
VNPKDLQAPNAGIWKDTWKNNLCMCIASSKDGIQ